MSFTAAAFLFGILAVGGPILAHLLARPRFRRVPFAMMRFLQSGQAEVESRRRFRDLLVLLLRCAIIVLLALLFAGPQVNVDDKQKPLQPVQFLAIDNSLSMNYREGGETLLDRALIAAAAHVSSAPEDARFRVYPLAGPEPSGYLNRAMTQAFLQKIRALPLRAEIQSFLSDLRAAKQKGSSESEASVFLCSDFTPQVLQQLNGLATAVPVRDLRYESLRPRNKTDNCGVLDGNVEVAVDGGLRVQATLANDSDTTTTRTFAVLADGRTAMQEEVSLAPRARSRIEREIEYDPPSEQSLALEMSLLEKDALPEDDTFYVGLSLPRSFETRVLVVGRDMRETFLPATAIQTLARHHPTEAIGVEAVSTGELSAERLWGAKLLILTSIPQSLSAFTDPLSAFVERGGRIIFFVSPSQNVDSLRAYWEAGLLPALPERLLNNSIRIAGQPEVSSPGQPEMLDASVLQSLQNYKIGSVVLTGYYECEAAPHSQALWRFEEGPGFLYYSRIGLGSVLLVNTSADDSLGALFKSPISSAFCRYLLGRRETMKSYAFFCGEPIALPAPSAEGDPAGVPGGVRVVSPKGKSVSVTPTEFGLLVDPLQEIGWLKTLATPAFYAGVNQPKRETDLSYPDPEQLETALHQAFPRVTAAASIVQTPDGMEVRPLWKAIGWILVSLLLFEMTLVNRLKR